MNLTVLPDDIAQVLAQNGLCAREIRTLTVTPDPERPRATFRVELDSGAIVKARRLESPEAARTQHELRTAMPPAFATVLARSGAVLIEEWVDGQPVPQEIPGEPTLREAGRLLASLHAVPRVGDRVLPYAVSTARLSAYVVSRLEYFRDVGLLDDGTMGALCTILEVNDPGAARCSLTHQDFCGENTVIDRAGRLRVIDNERAGFDFVALDLARTWYRWGLQDAGWDRFCAAYLTAGGSDTASSGAPFCRVAGVTVSAWVRLRSAHPALGMPVQVLRRLASQA